MIGIITTENLQHAQVALTLALSGKFQSIIVYTEHPLDRRARLHLFPTDDEIAKSMKRILIGTQSNSSLLGQTGYIFNVSLGVPNRQGLREVDPSKIIGFLQARINHLSSRPNSRI